MNTLKKTIVGVLTLLAAARADAAIRDAGAYLRAQVVQRTLSNGIEVLMLDRGAAPTLALVISFRVGSADESYDTIGMAHMLEHMLFKGTATIGTKDYRKEKRLLDEIEAVGSTIDRLRLTSPNNAQLPSLTRRLKELEKAHSAYVVHSPYNRIYSKNGGVGFNAFTSRDQTAYIIELPSSKLALWADLESQRLREPVMREFYLERNAVIEERLMRYESSGTGLLIEMFIATAYAAHPYRHPIIGWRSNIEFLQLDRMREFFTRHYVPARMSIAIVGKQNPAETLAVLERSFGRLPTRPEPMPTAIREPAQNGERRFEVFFDANPSLVMGWHKPTLPAKADFACEVIASLLSDGRSSRLYRRLVLERKIASSVSAWNGFPGSRYDNLFVVMAAPQGSHTLPEIEAAVLDEIARLAGDLRDDELERILNRIETKAILGLDSNMGIASLISHYQTIMKDWRFATSYLDDMRRITRADVVDAINTYLVAKNRTVGYLLRTRDRKK